MSLRADLVITSATADFATIDPTLAEPGAVRLALAEVGIRTIINGPITYTIDGAPLNQLMILVVGGGFGLYKQGSGRQRAGGATRPGAGSAGRLERRHRAGAWTSGTTVPRRADRPHAASHHGCRP